MRTTKTKKLQPPFPQRKDKWAFYAHARRFHWFKKYVIHNYVHHLLLPSLQELEYLFEELISLGSSSTKSLKFSHSKR